MSDIWVLIIFGWPAILLSLVTSVIGVLKKWPWIVMTAGVVAMPFSLYFSGYAIFYYTPFLLPFFLFGAAWAVRAKRKILPWILLIPLTSFAIILAILVHTQNG